MNSLKRNFCKCIVLCIVFIMAVGLTGCNSKTEQATIPIDSICKNIDEFGVVGFSSSLKSHYKDSQKEGDIGNINITLTNDHTSSFFSSPWWVDERN